MALQPRDILARLAPASLRQVLRGIKLPRFLNNWFGPSATRFDKMRGAAIVAYVLSLLSLAKSISFSGLDNEIGAVINVGETSEKSVFVTIRNDSRIAWKRVRVDADERYYLRLDTIAGGEIADAQIRQFRYRYALPRPTNMFFWEGIGGKPFPEPFAQANYKPSEVTVSCDQGHSTWQAGR